MKINKYDYLATEAKQIRESVFVAEQGFKQEFDNLDSIATHLVWFKDMQPIATCRYYEDKNKQSYVLGRIAVIKEFRGRHMGEEMVRTAERHIAALGGTKIFLSAQVQAEKFYKKQGYTPQGQVYFEEHCPHILMSKQLQSSIM